LDYLHNSLGTGSGLDETHDLPRKQRGASTVLAGAGNRLSTGHQIERVAVWARLILGRNWSGVITLKEGHELIERGPYRVVRHPIYTGILAMLAGTAIALGYFGGFLGFLLVFVSFWLKLKREEDLMLEHFPAKYAAYQRRVKRIIPFLV
jgi:protein-S-isoprenylcysteine O-methyltransferase Ste14